MDFDDSRTELPSLTRRSLLASVGATSFATFAGCLARDSESSFTPPSFDTTAGSVYATWLPEGTEFLTALSPTMSLRTAPQSVIASSLSPMKSSGISFGIDLTAVDHVIDAYQFRIATGSLDTAALEQRLDEQLPYEQDSTYGEFSVYTRTDDRKQTVAVGRETAISSAAYDEQLGRITSVIDTRFGDQPSVLESDGAFEAVADGIGHGYHRTNFSTPTTDEYESYEVPERMAAVARSTDEYGYQIHQGAFATDTDREDIEDFASEFDRTQSSAAVETTYTIEDVSGHPSLRHYARASRSTVLEGLNVTMIPDIAFSVEESAEAVTLTHEYGGAVDAASLELKGSRESVDESERLETQPSDSHDTFDHGSSLQASKQLAGDPVESIVLEYTKADHPYNTLLYYRTRAP